MSSISAARLGLCILRVPQAGVSIYFSQQNHYVTSAKSDDLVNHCFSRGISAVAGQKFRHPWTYDHLHDRNGIKIAETYRNPRPFITDPGLINTVLKCLEPWEHRTSPIIMECNPGPGLLSRALIDAGFNVVALESYAGFLPYLQVLEKNTNGQLKAVHCDFFKLDPFGEGLIHPPAMYCSNLMKILNIPEVPWTSDVPVKVFGILDQRKENIMLWRQIYLLYERLSIYRYGRIELNMFMSEAQYHKLVCQPGDYKGYRALSVLCQAAFDIQLLHKESWSTFLTPIKFRGSSAGKSVQFPDGSLCLVRLTPKRNLFSENFTPADGKIFINMIKQFLVKRKIKLVDKLGCWDPGNGGKLLEDLALPETIQTGNIYPGEYKLLYEILACSEEFHRSVFEEICEDIACRSYS